MHLSACFSPFFEAGLCIDSFRALQVLATGGDATLGGDDWDAAIMSHIDAQHLRPYGIDASAPAIRSRLRKLSRNVKERLSTSDKVAVRLPIGGTDGTGVSFTMTRQLLDDLCADLFRRCRLPIDQACWQAGVDLGTVLEGHSESIQRYFAHGHGQGPPTVEIVPKRRQPISEVRL
jgi:heat shock 70kDa protein 1/2/6/8